MTADKDFINQLISTDIVVWNGVVSRWGSVKEFYREGDMVRKPDDQEMEHYKNMQKDGSETTDI